MFVCVWLKSYSWEADIDSIRAPVFLLRENFQRLQQDLAQMILSCLERRSCSSVRRRTLSNQSEEDGKEGESGAESDSSQLEYLQLATVDNTLSTFL